MKPASPLDDPAGTTDGTVFVIPSIDLDQAILDRHARELAGLEERSLYLLFALRRTGVRLVVVTSLPVRPEVLEYYLRLIPDADEARARIELLPSARSGCFELHYRWSSHASVSWRRSRVSQAGEAVAQVRCDGTSVVGISNGAFTEVRATTE